MRKDETHFMLPLEERREELVDLGRLPEDEARKLRPTVCSQSLLCSIYQDRNPGFKCDPFSEQSFKDQLVALLRSDVRTWNHMRYDEFSLHPFLLDMRNVDLQELNLEGTAANLDNVDFSGADFERARLDQCTFRYSDFRRANLKGTSLCGARLHCADLEEAALDGSDIRGTWLLRASLDRASLRGTTITSEEESSQGRSYLDLVTSFGLDTATFDGEGIFQEYIDGAFAYAHRPGVHDLEGSVFEVQGRLAHVEKYITLLSGGATESRPPQALIGAVQAINSELIAYLARHPRALYEIRPRQFEELIAEILASYGWQIELTPATRDGGYDIFAISKSQSGKRTSWIVECKKYSENRKVGVDIVRGLYGVRALGTPADRLMLATTSYFTRGVHAIKSSRYDLELQDYHGILEWLNEYRPSPGGRLHLRDKQLFSGPRSIK